MDNSFLASFIVFAVDAGIVVFVGMLLFGKIQGRIYALGRWYHKDKDKSLYWQVMIGYVLLIVTLLYMRICVFPERLFPYLSN